MSPLNPQYLTKKQSVFQKLVSFVEKFKRVGGQILSEVKGEFEQMNISYRNWSWVPAGSKSRSFTWERVT